MDTLDKLRAVYLREKDADEENSNDELTWSIYIPDELLNKGQAKALRYNAIFYPANYNREDQDGTYISKLSEMSQILLSPVALHDWRQSLRIDCVLLEKPQILYRLLETLQDFGLDIIVDTSRSIQLNRFHYVSIIASAHSLASKFLVVEEKIPELVTQAILTKHMDFLAFRRIFPADKYEPAVKCYWLTGYQHLEGQERDGMFFNSRVTIKGNCLEVPPRWVGQIQSRKKFQIEHPDAPTCENSESDAMDKELRYIVHSDSNNQIISIYFPHNNLEICSVVIQVRDIKGALAQILHGLSAQNINVISTYLKEGVPLNDDIPESQDEAVHFEILCHLLDSMNFSGTVNEVREGYREEFKNRIQYVLNTKDLRESYEAKLIKVKVQPCSENPCNNDSVKVDQNTPQNDADDLSEQTQPGELNDVYSDNKSRRDYSDSKAARVREEFFKEYRKREEGRLEHPPKARYPISSEFEKWRELAKYQIKKIDDPQKIEDYRQRQHAEKKIETLRHILREGWFAKPRVFLSYNYERAGHEVANYVKAVFEKHNFVVVDGLDLVGSESIPDELLKLITSCRFLVGFAIKTNDVSTQHLSSWLIWEYGIATIHCDAYRLIVQKGVEIPDFANHRYVHEIPEDITLNKAEIEVIFDAVAADFKKKWRDRYWKHP